MKKYKVTDYEVLLPGGSKWIRLKKPIRWGLIFAIVFCILRGGF
jgi:hypothetical protein